MFVEINFFDNNAEETVPRSLYNVGLEHVNKQLKGWLTLLRLVISGVTAETCVES